MTSCVKPAIVNNDLSPVFLLHGFDSSCLEWRNTYPKLEKANIECWAFDILGWGFSHIQFWRSYLKKPMVLVGASLGGAAAIDFALAHPEAVSKLVLINAQGYAEGTGKMASFPRFLAYAGVSVLKNVLLRTYANVLIYHNIQWRSIVDQMNDIGEEFVEFLEKELNIVNETNQPMEEKENMNGSNSKKEQRFNFDGMDTQQQGKKLEKEINDIEEMLAKLKEELGL